MAIFISGMKCRFCGEPMTSQDDLWMSAAFLPPPHPLWEYADCTFHKACFDRWPSHDEFQSLYDWFRRIYDTRPRGLKSAEEIDSWYEKAFKGTPFMGEEADL